MGCGGDTILNNSAEKNTIKTEYSRILSQANLTHGGFSMGKVKGDSQEPLVLSKKYRGLMKNINHIIYMKSSQKQYFPSLSPPEVVQSKSLYCLP